MKLLDIALKDLLRSFRSVFFLMFGFVIPLLTSGLFYFAFGGPSSGEGGFNVPATKVQVVNLDQADPQYGGFSSGQLLVQFLRSDQLAPLLQVSEAADAASARAAVDRQEAGVAIIIPAGFTAAMVGSGGRAAVELYEDPTLTLGPGIVRGVVRQFVNGFAGSTIAVNVIADQLGQHGVAVDDAMRQKIGLEYGQWAQALGASQQGSSNALLQVRPPASEQKKADQGTASAVGMITAGMLVFYAFFTGAASAMSILQEEEAGTLPRVFTTPTPQSTILGGKYIAVLINLIVQVVVLLVASALLFKINWGQPWPLALVALAIIVLASSFGIFVTSLLKDTRMVGVIYGGVMTVLGMVGMLSVFGGSAPGASKATEYVSLVAPHGWGVRGLTLLLRGGGMSDVLLTVVVMLALAVIFFVIGVVKFGRRFA